MRVPVGTQVFAEDKETLLLDMDVAGKRVRLLKGGNGGFGNTYFKGPINQAPRHANPGLPGEERTIRFRLKLIADAGIVGLIGGATNLAYHASNQFIKWIAFGSGGDFLEIASQLGKEDARWKLLLVPTLGGLAAGLVVYVGLRLIGNPGLSNLLEVIVAGDGRLPLRSALVSAASSLTSISTGATGCASTAAPD